MALVQPQRCSVCDELVNAVLDRNSITFTCKVCRDRTHQRKIDAAVVDYNLELEQHPGKIDLVELKLQVLMEILGVDELRFLQLCTKKMKEMR